MRTKFGMEMAESTVHARIIVMEITIDDKTTVLVAIADSVNDVLEIDPNDIEPPPEIGSRWRSEFIKGIGKHNGNFIMILMTFFHISFFFCYDVHYLPMITKYTYS